MGSVAAGSVLAGAAATVDGAGVWFAAVVVVEVAAGADERASPCEQAATPQVRRARNNNEGECRRAEVMGGRV